MSGPLQVPEVSDLEEMGINVKRGEEPWEVYVKVQAEDGSRVDLSWSEVAADASVSWMVGERELFRSYRQQVEMISVNRHLGRLYFTIKTVSERVRHGGATLIVEVGEHVSVRDSVID